MLTNADADKGGHVSARPIYPTLEIQGPMLTVTVTVTEESESEDDTSGEEVDTNNSILESEDESEEETDLETVSVRPTFSVQGEGGMETILNLREWLKSPWAENE